MRNIRASVGAACNRRALSGISRSMASRQRVMIAGYRVSQVIRKWYVLVPREMHPSPR
jgi:hypothetical protein